MERVDGPIDTMTLDRPALIDVTGQAGTVAEHTSPASISPGPKQSQDMVASIICNATRITSKPSCSKS